MTDRWISVTAAAIHLRTTQRRVLRLAMDGWLDSRIELDHREVCGPTVEWVAELAGKYRATPVFMLRLAAYARQRESGTPVWEAASDLGRDPWSSGDRYERWRLRLGKDLLPPPVAAETVPVRDARTGS